MVCLALRFRLVGKSLNPYLPVVPPTRRMGCLVRPLVLAFSADIILSPAFSPFIGSFFFTSLRDWRHHGHRSVLDVNALVLEFG